MTKSARQPCPNPECRSDEIVRTQDGLEAHWNRCLACFLEGPTGASADEADRLWNLLPNDDQRTMEQCVNAAIGATLPVGFHWGTDALDAFNFGKRRAVQAIRDLSIGRQPELKPLAEAASNLLTYYENSLNAGPGPRPRNEAFLLAELRSALRGFRAERPSEEASDG